MQSPTSKLKSVQKIFTNYPTPLPQKKDICGLNFFLNERLIILFLPVYTNSRVNYQITPNLLKHKYIYLYI